MTVRVSFGILAWGYFCKNIPKHLRRNWVKAGNVFSCSTSTTRTFPDRNIPLLLLVFSIFPSYFVGNLLHKDGFPSGRVLPAGPGQPLKWILMYISYDFNVKMWNWADLQGGDSIILWYHSDAIMVAKYGAILGDNSLLTSGECWVVEKILLAIVLADCAVDARLEGSEYSIVWMKRSGVGLLAGYSPGYTIRPF